MNKYKGWSIKAYKQVYYPPFKLFNAIASKRFGSVMKKFNKEGNTLEMAIAKTKKEIDGFN